jgi:hypothetical protein
MRNGLVPKIRTRGHWEVVLRPSTFQADRLGSLRDCEEVIAKNRVRLRGWDFPHFRAEKCIRGVDFIEMATDFGEIQETWRFHTSALLIFYQGLPEDWLQDDLDQRHKLQGVIGEEKGLSIIGALYFLSEVYEFAGRLGQTGTLGESLTLEVTLHGTNRRRLFFWPEQDRVMWDRHACDVEELPRKVTESVPGFVGQSRELSLKHFEWIMQMFHFDIPAGSLRGEQDKLFLRRL